MSGKPPNDFAMVTEFDLTGAVTRHISGVEAVREYWAGTAPRDPAACKALADIRQIAKSYKPPTHQ